MEAKAIARLSYKTLAVVLVLYALVRGLTLSLKMPEASIDQLGQSARNLFYHVPLWFCVMALMGVSVYHSVRFLRMVAPDNTNRPPLSKALIADAAAREAARVGILFNILGLLTGMIWERVTWGANEPDGSFSAWWVWDPIQVCALISLLIYAAYFLLRSSFGDGEQRARISAVYNLFAFATLIPLYYILPKMLDGLHPTAAGSDAGGGSFIFKKGGVSNDMRAILYPGMIGFILLGVWLYELRLRISILLLKAEEE